MVDDLFGDLLCILIFESQIDINLGVFAVGAVAYDVDNSRLHETTEEVSQNC